MRHGSVRRQMSAFLDGDLGPAAAARVERHLAACPECRAELASLRRVVDWLHELPAEEPSASMAERVFARIEADGAARPGFAPSLRRWLETGWTAPLAAAAAGLLVLAWVQGLPEGLAFFGSSAEAPAALVEAPGPAASGSAVDVEGPQTSGATTLSVVDSSPAPADLGSAAVVTGASPDTATAQGDVLPPLASCFDPAQSVSQACVRWQAWMLGLALRDPLAFAAQLDAVPTDARETWIGQLSRIAADSGSAPLVAEQLRASHDPRLSGLAVRLERTMVPVASSADLPPQH